MPKKKTTKKSDNDLQKAYANWDFLNSPDARIIRVLSEMVEPAARFRKNHIRNTIVFFGSARTLPKNKARKNLKAAETRVRGSKRPSGSSLVKLAHAQQDLDQSKYYESAMELSEKLSLYFKKYENTRNAFSICSGGGPGIMEAANRGASKAKCKSIGLNISLPMEQHPNPYQTRELSFEFHYFFIRKFWFFYPAKAMVVFPGGFGTMDEFFELATLIQTNKTKKHMPVVLFGSEYWKKLVDFNHLVKCRYINPEDLDLFKMCDNVSSAFKYLKKELTDHYIK